MIENIIISIMTWCGASLIIFFGVIITIVFIAGLWWYLEWSYRDLVNNSKRRDTYTYSPKQPTEPPKGPPPPPPGIK